MSEWIRLKFCNQGYEIEDDYLVCGRAVGVPVQHSFTLFISFHFDHVFTFISLFKKKNAEGKNLCKESSVKQ